jgi:Putative MetA-pathway of phenol degradation
MSKRALLGSLAFCLVFSMGSLFAQVVCPLNGTPSNKLICLIPQVYGPLGLGSGPTAPLAANQHQAHFEAEFLANFGAITEAVGVQASQLPLASPSSGVTFEYDPKLKTFTPSTEGTLGPIFGERATTIGRNKFYIALSYQYFGFSSIDGQDTRHLPVIFQHEVFAPLPVPPNPAFLGSCPNQTGLTGTQFANNPCFVRDFIATDNSIDLKVHQFALYATYGLTRDLDVSIAVPVLDVRMGVISQATIVPNSVAPNNGVFHQFNVNDPAISSFCANVTPCLQASFFDSQSASGIGDIILRGKYTVHRWERAALGVGLDVRLPSGDAKNFLGSGATGVRPFGVFSYNARVSPHAEVGYEVNGDSILAGDFVGTSASGAKGSLPNRFFYVVGADVAILRRLTGAFDLFGQRLFSTPQVISTQFTDLGRCSDISCTTLTPGTIHPNIAQRVADVNITNVSLGIKYRAIANLVVTGNVLLKVDDGGLRARAVPLVGISYSF